MSLGDLAANLGDPERQALFGTESVGRLVRGAGAEFEALYRVQRCDLDELEHANNVSYVRWLEWITRQHNAAFGLGQDYLKANGIVFVVVDYQLQYLRACGLDEDVWVKTRVEAYGHYSHDRVYQIVAERSGSLLFEGSGRWVSMNLATGRLARMPEEYQRKVAAMAAPSVI
jgi:acyl-CoA thioester hydrolase